MERLIRVQSSAVFACSGIWGLAVLRALNPFLSLLLFVTACFEFPVSYCESVGRDSAGAGCMKQAFKPVKCSRNGCLRPRTR